MNIRSPLRRALNEIFGADTFDKNRPDQRCQRLREAVNALQGRKRRAGTGVARHDGSAEPVQATHASPPLRNAVLPSPETAPRTGTSWGTLPPEVRALVHDQLPVLDWHRLKLASRRDYAEGMTTPFETAVAEARETLVNARRAWYLDDSIPLFRRAGASLGRRTLEQAADEIVDGFGTARSKGRAIGAIAAGLGDRARPFVEHVAERIGNADWMEPAIDRTFRANAFASLVIECPDLPYDVMAPLVEVAEDRNKINATAFVDTVASHEPDSVQALRIACEAAIRQLKSMPYNDPDRPATEAYKNVARRLLYLVRTPADADSEPDKALQKAIRTGLADALRTLTTEERAQFFDDCDLDMVLARACITNTGEATATAPATATGTEEEETQALWDKTFDPLCPEDPVIP